MTDDLRHLAAGATRNGPLHLVVAGVAGGVGTTTAAALVSRALAAAIPGWVALVDHDGGTLAVRAGAGTGTGDDRTWAQTSGAGIVVRCAGGASVVVDGTPAADPEAVVLVVAPWHADGLRLATDVAGRVGPHRSGVLLVDLTRARALQPRDVRDLRGLPYDRALAAPGRVQDGRAAAAVRAAVHASTVDLLTRAARRTERARQQ